MTRARSPVVLFCAAAGPRRGFGHLVRCGVLADALGVERVLALSGSLPTVHAAIGLGWTVHCGDPRKLLISASPDLIVVDDPSPRRVRRWVRTARRFGVAVASIHDLGIARAGADVEIDGSVIGGRSGKPAHLQGPAFAILDSRIASLRVRPPARAANHVLIALGGGANARALAVRLAREISRVVPDATIQIAAGFTTNTRATSLPSRCAWLDAPRGLGHALATTSVAVVAGGMTLYEACALGTPVVMLPIVSAQRPTVRAFSRAHAAVDAGRAVRPLALARAALEVSTLLKDPRRSRSIGRRARRLIDGLGAARVARRLVMLIEATRDEVRRVA